MVVLVVNCGFVVISVGVNSVVFVCFFSFCIHWWLVALYFVC